MLSKMPLKPSGFSDFDFEQLLSPNRAINSKISLALDGIPNDFVVLFIVDLKNYAGTVVELLRVLQLENNTGVYLTINKPVEDLIRTFKAQRLDTEKIFFIDAISALSERKTLESQNIILLDSPTDLIEINNIVSKKIALEESKFVVFDSLSTLLLYNKPMAVEKFLHVLVGKMRGSRVKGFLITVKSSEHAGLIETISQFVDKIVEI